MKPAYRQPLSEAGHDGNPPRLRRLRDPGGDNKRILVGVVRADRWQRMQDAGQISDVQREAAQRMEYLWEKAQLQPYRAGDLGIIAGTPGHSLPSDEKLDALQRYSHAERALKAKGDHIGIAATLLAVQTKDSYAQIAKFIRIRKSEVGELVKGCLDILSDHFGYGAET